MNRDSGTAAMAAGAGKATGDECEPTLDKRICYLLESPDRVGANIRQQMLALKRLHARTTICFLSGDPDDFVPAGEVDEVVGLGLPHRALSGTRLRPALSLSRMLRKKSFDTLVCDQYKAVTTAALATALRRPERRPALYALLRGFFAVDSRSRRRMYWLMRRRLSGIIALTHAQKRRFLELLPWLTDDRVHVVHNYIDHEQVRAEMLERGTARRALGLPEDVFLFGTIARFDPYKRLTDLLEAMSSIRTFAPHARLVIIGDGRENVLLRHRADDLAVSDIVTFTGFLPKARRYMRAFDVFVLPSEGDNFARVFLEAMAAELPIIGVKGGGSPEVLGPDALLATPRDPESLARHMRRLLGLKPDESTSIGRQAYMYSTRHFTPVKLRKQLLAALYTGGTL